MSSPSYSINDLLKKPETQLNKLIAQAQAIEELNTRFAEILDPELTAHCRVGCWLGHKATLPSARIIKYTAYPAAVGRIRLYSNQNPKKLASNVCAFLPCAFSGRISYPFRKK
jgi:hypothetical protein